MKTQAKPLLAWAIFIAAISFFFFDTILRLQPSIATQQLKAQLGITYAGIGLLSSAFFYPYALLQLPIGLLLDRFGPRFLMCVGALLSTLALLVFTMTQYFAIAIIARVVMGVTAAAAFVGPLYLAKHILAEKDYGLASGLLATAGGLGAIVGQAFLAKGYATIGYRPSNFNVAIVGLILAFVYFISLTQRKLNNQRLAKSHNISIWANLKSVLSNFHSYRIGAMQGLICVPIAVFAGLWGVPYLVKVYHFNTATAASFISLFWYGLIIGGPAWGWLNGHIKCSRVTILFAGSMATLSSIIAIYVPTLSTFDLKLSLFIMGFANGVLVLNFVLITRYFVEDQAGTSSAIINFHGLLYSAIVQSLSGYILGKFGGGVGVYSLHGFKSLFSCVPVVYILYLFLGLFEKKRDTLSNMLIE